MTLMIIGLLMFIGAHLSMALFRDVRAVMISRLGENVYKVAYSLVSLAGIVLVYIGWDTASVTALYYPPAFMRHVTFLLMLFSIILLAAAYAPAGKIAHTVKHPMLAAVKLWAFAHLLSNGEVRSVIVFGAFLAFAVIDRIAVKRRGAPVREAGPVTNDAIAVAIGVVAYAAVMFFLHPYIGGVPIVFL